MTEGDKLVIKDGKLQVAKKEEKSTITFIGIITKEEHEKITKKDASRSPGNNRRKED